VVGRGAVGITPFRIGDTLVEVREREIPSEALIALGDLTLPGTDHRCTRVFRGARHYLFLLYPICTKESAIEEGESGVLIREDGRILGDVHAHLPFEFYQSLSPSRIIRGE
jgi:hypothetical protein